MKLDQDTPWFLNLYRCERCEHIWEDEWSCMCNDRCPRCHLEMSPVVSLVWSPWEGRLTA